LPGSLGDRVEELLGGERLGSWQVPDLPVGCRAIGQQQQPAGDVRQEAEGVRLVGLACPRWLLASQDAPEQRLARRRARATRTVIVGVRVDDASERPGR
jgi:hypothetical protein